jgi:Brinker DNA-binding domain
VRLFSLKKVKPSLEMSEKKKRRSFDLTFKLKVLKYAEQSSGEAAARHFAVEPKSIRIWKKQKSSLGTI